MPNRGCLCLCTSAQRLGENTSQRSGNGRGCEPCKGKLCAVPCADVPTLHSTEPRDTERPLAVFPAFGRAGSRNVVLVLHVCIGG